MKKRLKIWALNLVCKNLLKAVVEEDVLTIDSKTNILFLGGIPLTKQQIKELSREAAEFEKSILYGVLINTPMHQAQRVLFEKQTSFDDVWAGKMMLYTTNLQEKLVKKLSTLDK